MYQDITEINWSKSYIAKTAIDIKTTAAPLESVGIHHFSHVRLYADNSVMLLTEHPEFSELYVREKFYEIALAGDYDQYQPGYFLWNSISDQTIFKAFEQSNGFANGFSIFKRNEDYCDAFHFCAEKENKEIDLFYLNNIDLLEQFVGYYRDKASDIIQGAENHRYVYPETRNDNSEFVSLYDINPNSLQQLLMLHKSSLGFSDHLNLTKRQQQALEFLVKGYSTKEIARELGISFRTVEKYVAQLMGKFSVHSAKKLVAKVIAD